MCAIAGSSKKQEVVKMLKLQEHRGPDQNGTYTEPHYTIGMDRLSIIDVKAKNVCPYMYQDRVLVYNGEVYNYKTLRRELQQYGYSFETNSDTEVVLKAYLHWGVKCLDKFNGMFAFCVWDTTNDTLFLARDIAGEKPLYYQKDSSGLRFASEAKALKGEVREDEFFINFEHCYKDTLYLGVKSLLPAHYALYNLKTGKLTVKRWWHFRQRYINRSTAINELDELLKDAVDLRTQADVPYALYLSDGLDSNLINEYSKFESITFPEELDHKKDFYKNIKDIVSHLDFPVGSFSSYALFWLAREAKKRGYKVLLSGEGADEIFGGYVRYLPVAINAELFREYPSYKDLFLKTGTPSYTVLTARHGNREFIQERMLPFYRDNDAVTAMQLFDFTYILPSLLQMGDRMAGMFGLENRCPYLDRRVIEFGLSLPPDLKIDKFKTKVLLRDVGVKHGVRRDQEKKGLIIPYNEWSGIEGYDRSHYFKFITNIWKSQN